MDTTEFNRLLKVACNGGRRVVGAEASEIHILIRKMVCGFFRRKGIPLGDPNLIDDVVSLVFLELLRIKRIPEGCTWGAWFWWAVKGAWATHCRETLDPLPFSADEDPVEERASEDLPVPVLANARLMEGRVADLLRARAQAVAPEGTAGRVWGWAVDMLVDYGAVLDAQHASVRSGLGTEECRRIVVQAVVRVRGELEEIYGGTELYTIEECAEAREVARRIH